MHTDSSLKLLDDATTALGESLRQFEAITCTAFATRETSAEYAKRVCLHAHRVTKGLATADSAPSGQRPRTVNLNTPKTHFLGDYVTGVRWTGTSDSTSTQAVRKSDYCYLLISQSIFQGEFKHREIKKRYARTNKKDADEQLVAQEVIHSMLGQMSDELSDIGVEIATPSPMQKAKEGVDDEGTDSATAYKHHYIAAEQRNTVYLSQFIADHPDDPALVSFVHDLRDHLKIRLLAEDASWPPDAPLILDCNCIYEHATLHINFTTYDLRRGQDIIHVGTGKSFVMVRTLATSDSSGQPWAYARVLGVFHANVIRPGTSEKLRQEFLWVRWLQRDLTGSCTANDFRLPRVSFVPQSSPGVFGFLDPADVIRACHLIPAYHLGHTFSFLEPSLARDNEGDWYAYYVGRFVDRDMAMRFVGLGIGYHASRVCKVDALNVPIQFTGTPAPSRPLASPVPPPCATTSLAANTGADQDGYRTDEDSDDNASLPPESDVEDTGEDDTFEDDL